MQRVHYSLGNEPLLGLHLFSLESLLSTDGPPQELHKNAFSYTCYTPPEKGSAAPGRSPYNPGAGHAHVPLPEAFGWCPKVIYARRPCRRPFCWTAGIPRVDPRSTPARIRSTDFYVVYQFFLRMMWKTSFFTVFRGLRRRRLASNRAPVVSVMRAARTGLIDISWVLGTEVA